MRRDDLNGGVAAFFDLDGTLIAEPSLEKRFFAHLLFVEATSSY